MKRQITAALTAALILTGITACNQDVSQNSSSSQETSNTASAPAPELSNTESEVASTSTSQTAASDTAGTEPTKRVMTNYSEAEIPDLPLGSSANEGKAHELDNSEALKQCPDNIVFETHTVGDYKISLVGDSVRTDKANFPGSIYTDDLRIEVEKNGTAIGSESDNAIGYYNDTATYVSQFINEYRLFEDKLGSYIDMYELDNPVIAMRYFYDDDPERTVKNAVEFATIQNNEVCTGFVGISEKGTGVILNPDGGTFQTSLILNTEDGAHCRMSTFAADKFKIVDNKTLCDEEAKIKYSFDFSDTPKMELYTAEKV